MWDLRDYARIRGEGKILGLRHEGNYVSVEWEEYERQLKSLSQLLHSHHLLLFFLLTLLQKPQLV